MYPAPCILVFLLAVLSAGAGAAGESAALPQGFVYLDAVIPSSIPMSASRTCFAMNISPRAPATAAVAQSISPSWRWMCSPVTPGCTWERASISSALSPWPRYAGVTPAQRAHRLLLRSLMPPYRFKPYPKEWWRFTLADEPYPESWFDFAVTWARDRPG